MEGGEEEDGMMYYLLLLLMPVMSCCQTASQKQYTVKHSSPNVILFSAVTSVIAFFFFLFTSGFQLEFRWALVPYALCFGVAYAAAWVGTVLALRYGLMAISTLIISFSLIFPTVYGIILGESVTWVTVAGMALLFLAMVLVNLQFGKGGRFSWKWFLCVMVAFFGNGVCSISQNLQKRALGESYTHEFMMIALICASVLLFGYALMTSKNIRADFRACLPYSAANGIANAVSNFLLLTMIGNIPNTVLYPTNSALGMIASFLLGHLKYKERFGKLQYIGYVMGVISIILLNL